MALNRVSGVILAVWLAILLSGCSSEPSAAGVAPLLSNSAARPPAPAIPDAPAEVAGRLGVPACGRETTTQDSGFNTQARLCFWTAYLGGRPAEFISTRPTIEGDPITYVYRVLGTGQVEVFIDSNKDKCGSGAWTKLVCRTLGVIDSGVVVPDFGPDGSCIEVPVR